MNHNFHSKKFKIEFGSGALTKFCKKKTLKSVLALIGIKNVFFFGLIHKTLLKTQTKIKKTNKTSNKT